MSNLHRTRVRIQLNINRLLEAERVDRVVDAKAAAEAERRQAERESGIRIDADGIIIMRNLHRCPQLGHEEDKTGLPALPL
jgi:hypothetical protein